MRFPRKRGATGVKVRVFIPDNSVTNGAGCTGLTYASTNLAIAYSRENDNGGTEVTGANLLDIATVGTWADPTAGKLRFKAVDATKMPGLYEVHFPDAAAFGTGDASSNIVINVYEKTTTALKIGPNMVMIPLSSLNVLDGQTDLVSILGTALTETAGLIAAAFKKFFNVAGPTATCLSLPDVVPGAASGLPTVATGGVKLDQTVDLTAGQSIAASSVPAVTLANGAHGGAGATVTLQTPIAASVASVPDSAGVATLLTRVPDTVSLAAINAEVDAALDTAIPGTPTADSINERVKAIDDLTQASGAGDLAAVKTQLGNIHDADLPAVKTDTEAILLDTAEIGTAGAGLTAIALSATERNAIADAHLDRADAVETGVTPRQAHRLEVAASAGVTSGMATATPLLKNPAGTKTRVTATADAEGNRTAITFTDLT